MHNAGSSFIIVKSKRLVRIFPEYLLDPLLRLMRCELIRGICAAQERWRHVVVVFFKHGAFPFPDERGAVYPFRGDLFCQSARKVIVVCALHLEGDVVTALIFNAAYAEIMSVCRDIASQCSK